MDSYDEFKSMTPEVIVSTFVNTDQLSDYYVRLYRETFTYDDVIKRLEDLSKYIDSLDNDNLHYNNPIPWISDTVIRIGYILKVQGDDFIRYLKLIRNTLGITQVEIVMINLANCDELIKSLSGGIYHGSRIILSNAMKYVSVERTKELIQYFLTYGVSCTYLLHYYAAILGRHVKYVPQIMKVVYDRNNPYLRTLDIIIDVCGFSYDDIRSNEPAHKLLNEYLYAKQREEEV